MDLYISVLFEDLTNTAVEQKFQFINNGTFLNLVGKDLKMNHSEPKKKKASNGVFSACRTGSQHLLDFTASWQTSC